MPQSLSTTRPYRQALRNRALRLLTLLNVALACQPGTGPGPDPAVGRWELQTIDGQPLPAQSPTSRINEGYLEINIDHTFEGAYWQTNAQGGQGGWIASSGAWRRYRGGVIELHNTLGSADSRMDVTVQGDELIARTTWIYRRN